ncbi:MAG: DUF1364 family protein [Patescibacteria group bacterium]|nr:DUF1364 family protein [Patescibacteria group bacterium]
MNLRKLARGRACTVRLPGICDHGTDTTVLAHFRLAGISGMGIKPPDAMGAHACAPCHAYVDSHKDAETQLAFAHAVMRTQAWLISEGYLKW